MIVRARARHTNRYLPDFRLVPADKICHFFLRGGPVAAELQRVVLQDAKLRAKVVNAEEENSVRREVRDPDYGTGNHLSKNIAAIYAVEL